MWSTWVVLPNQNSDSYLAHVYCAPGSVGGYASILSDEFSKQPHFTNEEVTLACQRASVK